MKFLTYSKSKGKIDLSKIAVRLIVVLVVFFTSYYVAASEVKGQVIIGTVVKVVDGDTIHVLIASSEKIRVRLHGIDAPERKQDFNRRSKEALGKLLGGKIVRVEMMGRDRWGRIIGKPFAEGIDACEWMVGNGWAWHWPKYAREDKILADAQEAARIASRGLWSVPGAVPPWSFRKANAVKSGDTINLDSVDRELVDAAGEIQTAGE